MRPSFGRCSPFAECLKADIGRCTSPLERNAWAFEWNRNFRVAGLFGDTESITALLEDLPMLGIHTVYEGPDRRLRMRTEQPLADKDDVLFDAPLSAVSAGASA